MKNKKIIILSASRFSALTLSVSNLLLDSDYDIKSIICKNIYSGKVLKKQLRQEGLNLFYKIYKKIILQIFTFSDSQSKKLDGFSSYYKKFYKNGYKSVKKLCKKTKIEFFETDDFHSKDILNIIDSHSPDLIVFTGGGIIKESLLEIPKIGILNCHMGILPNYRGLDSTFWALKNNDFNNIGLTTHLMDKGIDTGPIIKKYPIHSKKIKNLSLEKINKIIEYRVADSIIESVDLIFNDKFKTKKQSKTEGKLYFKRNSTQKKK